jgi:ribosomal protein S6--L-glutamate ligase
LVPSGLSQLASRSKVFQSTIFSPFMVPLTTSVYDLHGLTETINLYGSNSITRVVTKHDRRNAGMGVHLWSSIEEVYNHASLGTLLFPFMLQPFQPNSRDIRAIIIGDYEEAYWRHNPNSFRNNLHCGGESKPCELTEEQYILCHQVMRRGQFPYAHLDIMVTEDNTSYLGEINLRGGMRGAKINIGEYQERIAAVHELLLNKILETH